MRIDRVGPRTWAIALLAALSVADPGMFTRIGLYVALAVWFTGAPGRFRADRIFWLVVLMLGWMALTTLWAINPNALNFVYTAAAIAITFLLSRDAIRTLPQLRTVAVGYVVASFVAVVRVLIENDNSSTSTSTSEERLTLVGLNANYLGYALVGALVVVVILWNTGPSRRARVALLIAVIGVLVGLQLTDTRGAAVGAVCLAAWLILCWALKRAPVAALVIAVSVAALVITSGVFDVWIRSIEIGDRVTGDWSGRLLLWPIARDLWDQSWFFGSGPSAMRVTNAFGSDAHSVFLDLGSAQGIVGVVIFILFIWTALGHDIRSAAPDFRALIVGSFLVAVSPAYLSGSWEASPAAWMLVLIVSRVGVFEMDANRTPVVDREEAALSEHHTASTTRAHGSRDSDG